MVGLYFQNEIWLSTYLGPKKVFDSDPNPKNCPEGPKKYKKAQNLAELKTKR